ncbi:MAG TPA: matrixin family metalloprotease [Chthoniobacterales bacterium]
MKSAIWAITAAIVGLSATSRGYVLEGQSWPASTVVVLQLSLGNAGRTLQDGNTSWNDAVAPVANMWNSNVQRVQVTQVLNSGVPAASGDHLNSVVFANNVFGQPFGGNTLAVTYYRYSGSTMAEADTLFNRAQSFDSYRGPLQFPGPGPAIADIRRVFLHELGHALGLAHPDTAGQHVIAVMNSIISNQEVLSDDDIAGGQFIYGAPPAGTPTPTPGGTPSHLANISTRIKIGLGDDVLIGGFIISGTQSKKVILRAIGPSLTASGVANVLADPVLELHDSGGVIGFNDDWQSGSQAGEITASGFAPNNPRESAIIATLSPGNYTAVVSGYGNGQGVGLVEAYELDANATRLVNISTRGRVGLSDDVMIGGLIVQGGNVKRVIVRALGPSLATGPNPIAGALADPILELRDGSGVLMALNDNWINSPQYAEIVATTVPPPNTMESAIIAICGPGNYTAIVRGVNNTSGVGLVEVYDLDP